MEHSMKRLIIWLARKFDVNIVQEKIVVNEVVEYRYLTQGTIEGDLYVQGDLLIEGKLVVNGGVTLFKED
jgi:hypothetical protein